MPKRDQIPSLAEDARKVPESQKILNRVRNPMSCERERNRWQSTHATSADELLGGQWSNRPNLRVPYDLYLQQRWLMVAPPPADRSSNSASAATPAARVSGDSTYYGSARSPSATTCLRKALL